MASYRTGSRSCLIPAGKEVRLDVSAKAASDLTPLAKLVPDALQGINLSETSVTDAGLANVGNLSGLLGLDLTATRISNDGLAHLTGLTKLRGLTLAQTGIGDAGLRYLEGLEALEWLELSETRVTDAGLDFAAKPFAIARAQPVAHGGDRRRAGFTAPASSVATAWPVGDQRDGPWGRSFARA